MQTVLDVVLNRFEARYVTFHRGIDELLAVAAPDERDVATLRDKVPNSLDALEYFFGKAGSAWLAPLNAAGFFDRPPATEEGYRVPTWPQSRYLARMAAAEPDRVIGIAQFVADTRNVRVQEDLMKAPLAPAREHRRPRGSVRQRRRGRCRPRARPCFPECSAGCVGTISPVRYLALQPRLRPNGS